MGDYAELNREFDFEFDNLIKVGVLALEFLVIDFQGRATEKANIKTGNLRSSIQRDGGDTQWRVGTNLEYAPYVHDGSPPHEINPRFAQALAFDITATYLGVSKTGGAVFARVQHPGYKGNPFFDDSLSEVEGELEAYLEQAMEVM